MRVFLAAILLAGASTPAAAEEWYYVGSGDDGIVFADADSVQQAGEAVAVRGFLGSDLPFNDVNDAETFWYLISQFEFRCSNSQYRLMHTDYYDEGHRLADSKDYIGEWAAIPADSYAQFLRQFACDGIRLGAVPDPFDDADDYFEFGS